MSKTKAETGAPQRRRGASVGSVTARLQQVLIEWRAAEREHARAVLCAAHPDRIMELANARERALHHVRLNVDSEPWAEIFRESLNTEVRRADQ